MFEKESKEYANKWLEHVKELELQHKTDDKPEYIRIEEAHQKGAEFGYKKGFEECAKSRLNVTTISDCPIKDEWHYPSKGEYPKDENKVLCVISELEELYCKIGYYSQVETEDYRWNFEDYVMKDKNEEEWGVFAWKEIVFPELKESKQK